MANNHEEMVVVDAIDDVSDTESEMKVMEPSDSMSSMGSNMMRVDSNATLSQTQSFQDLNAGK